MFRATVELGQIKVCCETNLSYPDAAQDVTNRAHQLLVEAVKRVRDAGWMPFEVEIIESDDDETADDETVDKPKDNP